MAPNAPIFLILRIVNLLALALANLAGLVVAIILLVRRKGTPAILATIAFGLAFTRDLGNALRLAFLDRLVAERGIANYGAIQGGINCCCNILTVIGIGCLIVALWQALSDRQEAV